MLRRPLTATAACGYRIGTIPDDEIPEVSVSAKPATGQAIADTFLLGSEPDAAARVSTTSLGWVGVCL